MTASSWSVRGVRAAAARATRDPEHEQRMAHRQRVLDRYGRLVIGAVQAGRLVAGDAARLIADAQNRVA